MHMNKYTATRICMYIHHIGIYASQIVTAVGSVKYKSTIITYQRPNKLYDLRGG